MDIQMPDKSTKKQVPNRICLTQVLMKQENPLNKTQTEKLEDRLSMLQSKLRLTRQKKYGTPEQKKRAIELEKKFGL